MSKLEELAVRQKKQANLLTERGVASLVRQISELKQRLDQKDQTIQKLQHILDENGEASMRLRDTLSELESLRQEARSRKSAGEAELQAAKEEGERWKARVGELEQVLEQLSNIRSENEALTRRVQQ